MNFSNAETSGKDQSQAGALPMQSKSPVLSARTAYNKTLSVTGFGNQSMANCNEILSNLDGKLCMVALEYILTLLLSQSYLAIKDTHLSIREKQLIKRELSAELGILNEFLKKKLSLEHIGTLHRKKHGSTPILNDAGDTVTLQRTGKQQPSAVSTQQRRQSTPRDSMRVNVVRRLHLQQKVVPNVLGSTPRKETNQSTVTFDNITPIKRSEFVSRDADIEYLDLEEPTDMGLSTVEIVEADYLHILSNMFAVVCHSEK